MSTSSAIGMSNATDFINREFLSCGNYQWVREVLKNAEEGDAKKVEFGFDWEAVEKLGVYRRMITDNGKGMSAEHLFTYFKTVGQTGKEYKHKDMFDNAVHSNFGVGCRISLLPWNQEGVVYISYVKGKGSLLYMFFDKKTNVYSIKDWKVNNEETGESEIHNVIDVDSVNWKELGGVNWSKVAPDWAKEHGTCIVLLGNSPHHNTLLTSEFEDKKANTTREVTKYINSRFWDLSHIEVVSKEFNYGHDQKNLWPKKKAEYHSNIESKNNTARGTSRRCRGTKYYISIDNPSGKLSRLKDSGTLSLEGGKLKVDWFLREGELVSCSHYAPNKGFVAVRYNNELFDFYNKHHLSQVGRFRNFGISDAIVRDKVYIILEPQHFLQSNSWGICPDTSRTNLIFTGNGQKKIDLPLIDWGLAFASKMPLAINNMIKAQQSSSESSVADRGFLRMLLSKLGKRFKQSVTFMNTNQSSSDQLGSPVIGKDFIEIPTSLLRVSVSCDSRGEGEEKRGKGSDKDTQKDVISLQKATLEKGVASVLSANIDQDLPKLVLKHKEDFEKPYHILAYIDFDAFEKGPVVALNIDSPAITSAVRHYQDLYNETYSESIEHDVRNFYGTIGVCKVAHILKFSNLIPKEKIKAEYLNEKSLTVSLLGLISEDAFISPKLIKYGARLKVEVEARQELQ